MQRLGQWFIDQLACAKHFFRTPDAKNAALEQQLNELREISQKTSRTVSQSHGLLKRLASDMQADRRHLRKKRANGAQ